MYHTIVKTIVRKSFEHVSNRNYELMLKDCAPNVKHRFGGNHALGGERNDIVTLRQWFKRLGTVLPNLKLTVRNVWVKGWPHHTTIFVRWDASATLANGEPYQNRGVHIITMKWGKVHSLDEHVDSQAVAEALKKQAQAGISEAAAAKLES